MVMAPVWRRTGGELTSRDYQTLAQFRRRMRAFVHFSEAQARRQGLTPQQHQLLLAVRGMPDREWATIGELSDFLQLKNHSVVGLVNRAVSLGLVSRRPSSDDHRVTQIYLTAQGEAILEALSVAHKEELRRISGEIRQLLKVLEDGEP